MALWGLGDVAAVDQLNRAANSSDESGRNHRLGDTCKKHAKGVPTHIPDEPTPTQSRYATMMAGSPSKPTVCGEGAEGAVVALEWASGTAHKSPLQKNRSAVDEWTRELLIIAATPAA